MIEVVEPGFATTIQDEGRPGCYHQGIAPSGAMDLRSYRLANVLVGNSGGEAALELTFTGPRLRFPEGGVVAVTGGDIAVLINGVEAGPWRALTLAPADELSFGFVTAGTRAYVAIRGGIDVPPVEGSRSTHVLIGVGGIAGRAIQAGDQLPIGRAPAGGGGECKVPDEWRPEFPTEVDLRYVPGLFDYRLTDTGARDFQSRRWTVTPNADRTGIRLSSPEGPLEFVDAPRPFGAGQDPSNVVDAGYPVGAIQIPSGTEPIVLSRDAVTAGGYFTLGTVISTDLDKLGQCPTHGGIRFISVTVDEAIEIRRQAAAELRALISKLT